MTARPFRRHRQNHHDDTTAEGIPSRKRHPTGEMISSILSEASQIASGGSGSSPSLRHFSSRSQLSTSPVNAMAGDWDDEDTPVENPVAKMTRSEANTRLRQHAFDALHAEVARLKAELAAAHAEIERLKGGK